MTKLKASAVAMLAALTMSGAAMAQDEVTPTAHETAADVAPNEAPAAAANETATTANEELQLGQRSIDIQQIGHFLQRNPNVLEQVVTMMDFEIQPNQTELDAAFVAMNRADIFNDAFSPVYGNPDGDVVITAFTDFNCPHCVKFNAELNKFIESEPRAKVIVRELPVLGDGSVEAARFAVAINKLKGGEAYKTVKDMLFAVEGKQSIENYDAILEAVGLSKDEVVLEMMTSQINDYMSRNHAIARGLRISSVPSIVIKDVVVRGSVTAETLQEGVALIYDAASAAPADDVVDAEATAVEVPAEEQGEVKAD